MAQYNMVMSVTVNTYHCLYRTILMYAVHKAYLVVNDMLNVWDIQSPSGHIRRQQNTTEEDICIPCQMSIQEAMSGLHAMGCDTEAE